MSDKRQNQIDLVRRALLCGSPVNAMAVSAHGIWRLSSIICRLRRRGWPIITEQHQKNGLAHYSLPKGWSPPC
jgi:hypothetical protein